MSIVAGVRAENDKHNPPPKQQISPSRLGVDQGASPSHAPGKRMKGRADRPAPIGFITCPQCLTMIGKVE